MNVEHLTPEMDEFLRGTRLGHFAHGTNPYPHTVPVWFDWTGSAIEFFTRPERPKVQRLADQPAASMVVSAEAHEPPRWIAVDGQAELSDDAVDLVHRLCDRYCDMDTEAGRSLHAEITGMADKIVKVTIKPERIRTFG